MKSAMEGVSSLQSSAGDTGKFQQRTCVRLVPRSRRIGKLVHSVRPALMREQCSAAAAAAQQVLPLLPEPAAVPDGGAGWRARPSQRQRQQRRRVLPTPATTAGGGLAACHHPPLVLVGSSECAPAGHCFSALACQPRAWTCHAPSAADSARQTPREPLAARQQGRRQAGR